MLPPLLHAIQAKTERINKRPFIIAVSGFAGSGKSTLAGRVAETLRDTEIIPLDHFITHRLVHRDEDWSGFDRERFRREVLIPAREGKSITYGVYSWPDDAITSHRTVPPSLFLIVEGCSLFHPDLLPYYDFIVWIDMPLEESARRGAARDKALGADHDKNWQDIWMPNDRDFFQKYSPQTAADFVYEDV
ncbi:MAG: phosphoglycerate transporter [Pseudomonadota bacterium]|nr:phosphoglycerate transporter [Pseudomonadota bacterium]